MKKTNKEEFIKEEFIERHAKNGNISLILESYTDIFSDFDPRPYDQRTLSDDFLLECKKAVRRKNEDHFRFELLLLIPKIKKNKQDEEKIKKRLLTYFEKHYHESQMEQRKARNEAIRMLFIGALITLAGALLRSKAGLMYSIMVVILEPAGWFTMWNGFDRLILEPREKKQEYDFYKKMAHMDIKFYPY